MIVKEKIKVQMIEKQTNKKYRQRNVNTFDRKIENWKRENSKIPFMEEIQEFLQKKNEFDEWKRKVTTHIARKIKRFCKKEWERRKT